MLHDPVADRREQTRPAWPTSARARRDAQPGGDVAVDVLEMDDADPLDLLAGDARRRRHRRSSGVRCRSRTARARAVEEAVELVGGLDQRVDVRVNHLGRARAARQIASTRSRLANSSVHDAVVIVGRNQSSRLPTTAVTKYVPPAASMLAATVLGDRQHRVALLGIVQDERHETAEQLHAVLGELGALGRRVGRQPAERALLHRGDAELAGLGRAPGRPAAADPTRAPRRRPTRSGRRRLGRGTGGHVTPS